MHILVTGALGHIGSRLIRCIPTLLPGADICLLDNLSTQRYCSLFDLPDDAVYRFVEADVLTADLVSLCRGVDVVIHLAALIDDESVPAATIDQVNRGGTERIARACAETHTALIFVSTTSVYGTLSGAVDEECRLADVRLLGPYTRSKWNGEQILEKIGREHGLRFVICRFGSIVGVSPGMRFHTAVSKFCWQALTGVPLTVWQHAVHQERPYLDLGDAVRVLIFLLQRRLFDGRTYNVVSFNTTVSEVVQAISTYVPQLQVRYTDPPIPNQPSYRVESGRLKDLGFAFTGTLDRGVSDTTRLLRTLIEQRASVLG